jgi:hypothetical protein
MSLYKSIILLRIHLFKKQTQAFEINSNCFGIVLTLAHMGFKVKEIAERLITQCFVGVFSKSN